MKLASATFGLAPMEGVSDWPFRLWFSLNGPLSFMSTPFLRATDTYPKTLPEDFAPEFGRVPASYALIPQVMASKPEDFLRAARLWLDVGADFVDLNCGCPSPNPISGGAGSSLLKSEDTFLGFVEAVASALPLGSFSVKMRTGFEDETAFAGMIAGLKDIPLRQLTVHGRTRRDRYDGDARWDLISYAQRELPFPVVASGDIVSLESWQAKAKDYPDIRRVIVGRGAIRNPWIFRELAGETTVISRQTLLYSLAIFGKIMDLSFTDHAGLVARARDGVFTPCGTDERAWGSLYETLVEGDMFSMKTERFAFGRVKMLWNSLRSSLPAPFFEPMLLRRKSLGEFLEAIAELGPESFEVQHQKTHDWLYTSSKKNQEVLPSS